MARVLGFAAAAVLALLAAPEGPAAASCAATAPKTAVRLPAPVVVTTWYRVDDGRLTIGHGLRTLWHSRGRFDRYPQVGVVVDGRRAIVDTATGRALDLGGFVGRLPLVAPGERPNAYWASEFR